MSGAPINNGTNQFPQEPNKIGITEKKIIINACAVIITLYNWEFPSNIPFPGVESSKRITPDSAVPTTPENPPKIRYNVPISL